MEISLQQLILIIGITSGLVWYFSRCGTQRMFKFKINWWFNHRFVRWCEHTETRLENWNKKMTKPKWVLFVSVLLSAIFVPIMIWSSIIPSEEKGLFGEYGIFIYLIEWLGLIGWTTFLIYKKSPQHSNAKVKQT